MVSSCTIIPTRGSRFEGGVRSGGVVVATLSATARTKELGAKIGMVYFIISAVGGIAKAHRRITIQHLNHFLSFYLFQCAICKAPQQISKSVSESAKLIFRICHTRLKGYHPIVQFLPILLSFIIIISFPFLYLNYNTA
jgi:hypothetical protein